MLFVHMLGKLNFFFLVGGKLNLLKVVYFYMVVNVPGCKGSFGHGSCG